MSRYLTFLILFISITTLASTGDRFTYFSFETYRKANNTYYLVISAPVKNWHNAFSPSQKNAFIKNFREQANKRAGISLITDRDQPLPADSNYERYTSFSECKKAVWRKMDKHEAMYKNRGTVKTIYVQF